MLYLDVSSHHGNSRSEQLLDKKGLCSGNEDEVCCGLHTVPVLCIMAAHNRQCVCDVPCRGAHKAAVQLYPFYGRALDLWHCQVLVSKAT